MLTINFDGISKFKTLDEKVNLVIDPSIGVDIP